MWIFQELSLARNDNLRACPIAVSREAYKFVLTSLTGSCFWTMLSLDPRSDDDVNSNVSSLYVEIIDKNRSYYKCTICGGKLSRKQNSNPLCASLVAVLIDLLISSVKHDQSDDPGNKKWRFDAKGKPSRSTLIMLQYKI